MNMSVRKRLASFVILGLLGSCWKGLATDTPFLDIVGYDRYDGDKHVHVFIKRGGEEVEFKEDEVFKVVDPSYDQLFKRLFTGTNKEGIYATGADRLKALLNSILFPEAKDQDFQIRSLEYLSNESTRLGDQRSAAGSLRYDLACKCTCSGNAANGSSRKTVVYDVEMQRSWQGDFCLRLFDYAARLKGHYDASEVASIGFINYPQRENHQLPYQGVGVYSRDEKGNPVDLLSDMGSSWAIDLKKVVEQIKSDSSSDIDVCGQSVGVVGKQWMAFLGLRHIYKVTNKTRQQYTIPLCKDLDPLITDSLRFLSNLDEMTLFNAVRDQEALQGAIDGANQVLKEENRKQAEKLKQQEKVNSDLLRQIGALRAQLKPTKQKRDDKNMENLKKNGGSPEAVALLKGAASSDPSKEVS